MKMRLGYESPQEIIDVLPIRQISSEKYSYSRSFRKTIIQRRCRFRWLSKCIDTTKHKLYYNGDITSVAKFHEMQERYPYDHWMIGRGLISDPFLPSMIKIIRRISTNKMELFSAFHDTLYAICESLSGSTHIFY
jgi:tRNA-dihydrouridine synthase